MIPRYLKVAGLLLVTCVVGFSIFSLQLSIPAPSAFLGTGYASSVGATGGVAPYTYAIIGGTLPPGLTLNTGTGAITGFPNTVGSFTFTAQVTDSSAPPATSNVPQSARPRSVSQSAPPAAGATVSSSFTITVLAGPPPAPLPPSVLLAAIGLVLAGLYSFWRNRRTA
jgi:hypothetical protein